MRVVKMIFVKVFFAVINIGIASAQFLECAKNEDCIAKDATCVNHLCECPVDKIFSLDSSQCLDVTFAYDSPCVEDQQCGWLLGDHQCIDGKCGCASGWVYYKGQCIKRAFPKTQCSMNDHCYNGYDLLAMVCKDDVCECNDGYYLRGGYDCRPISGKDEYCSLNTDCQFTGGSCQNSFCRENKETYNASLERVLSPGRVASVVTARADVPCKSDNDCTTLPNSMCNTRFEKCLCKRGYRYAAGTCIPELGTLSNCGKDSDCQFKYTRCLDGKCYCRKTYFTMPGNTACQKPMTYDNLFCNNNERCFVLGSEGVCQDNACRCSTSDAPNDDYVCEAIACQSNSDCSQLANSVCEDKLCQCPPNFHRQGKSCLPDLGSKCSDEAPCSIENGSCQNGVCKCNKNFVQNGKVCSSLTASINEACDITEQCSLIPNTDCVNGICKCAFGFVEIESKCLLKRRMGDACSSTSQCRTFLGQNVKCRNGYCDCPADMVATATKYDCESSSHTLSFSYFTAILLLTFHFMNY